MKSQITEIAIAILVVIIVAAISILNKGKSRLVPLEIQLPRAMFVGTKKLYIGDAIPIAMNVMCK